MECSLVAWAVTLGTPRRPMITEQQYRKLMISYNTSGVVSDAAMKAAMHRETAARYLKASRPAQCRADRSKLRDGKLADH